MAALPAGKVFGHYVKLHPETDPSSVIDEKGQKQALAELTEFSKQFRLTCNGLFGQVIKQIQTSEDIVKGAREDAVNYAASVFALRSAQQKLDKMFEGSTIADNEPNPKSDPYKKFVAEATESIEAQKQALEGHPGLNNAEMPDKKGMLGKAVIKRLDAMVDKACKEAGVAPSEGWLTL